VEIPRKEELVSERDFEEERMMNIYIYIYISRSRYVSRRMDKRNMGEVSSIYALMTSSSPKLTAPRHAALASLCEHNFPAILLLSSSIPLSTSVSGYVCISF